jgi:hypothetical protein
MVTREKFFGIIKNKKILIVIGLVLILAIGSIGGYFIWKNKFNWNGKASIVDSQKQNNTHTEFLLEIWDIIKENYWEKLPDDQLANLYKLGSEKLAGKPVTAVPKTKEETISIVETIIKDMDPAKKKEFTVTLGDIVLANLKPFGRSRLFSQKQQEELKNTVENKDPKTDLYATLEVPKDAPKEEIVQKYEEKTKTVDTKTTEGQKQMAELDRAKNALANDEARKNYDEQKVEPTVISEIIKPDIFYIRIYKISPQTFDEFQKAANSTEDKKLKSLIVDLRGNIGGAVDILPYFLGPFIGPNSYAYDFFHQGDYTPYKTKVGWLPSLVKFKKVVVLIDGESQSSAEIMAATLKKYNVGAIVGTHTKGWGTIEQLMPLKTTIDGTEKYAILMVHSLTIRDDGQPIEGQGVEPLINIKDKDWDKQLGEYVGSTSLVEAVKKYVNKK